jgi:polyisoprenyl-phosphate glycosyltransferase
MPRVAAIIPAFNEERTIGDVVAAVRLSGLVDDVIVVSDGSRDATGRTARAQGARVVELPENLGKGGAIAAGLAATDAHVLLLLDGDLVGLTSRHVADLLEPVLRGDVDVSIGQIKPDLIQRLFPNFSGQRAVQRTVLEAMSDLGSTGFGVEAALSRHVKDCGLRSCTVPLGSLTHLSKLEKHGILRGYVGKLKATWQIAKWSGRNGRSKLDTPQASSSDRPAPTLGTNPEESGAAQ